MSYTVPVLVLAAALGLVGPAALIPTMPRPRRYVLLPLAGCPWRRAPGARAYVLVPDAELRALL